MYENVNLALVYIRNGHATDFPVKDIDQAVRLADAIADSDLLNIAVDFNMFEVFYYHNGQIGESWEDECGDGFEEYWNEKRRERRDVMPDGTAEKKV